MFETVLIANRGEIAVRVMAACRELGIDTVAIYSDADEDAGHVRYADEAYRVGPARAAESYLDQDAIIEIAQEANADAIHPGYGFLAENEEFARRVESTDGLTWIGPSSDAMTQLGSKTSARETMAAAGVPIVPGTTEPVSDADAVASFGDEHGYPVAIKADGGGGGRGMKVIHEPAEIPDKLAQAQREGEAYFDNADVYLERYLEDPRHVEVQILADQHDTVVHLHERGCSLQRRHQKIVEEGPAPALSQELREEICAAARQGAREAGYTNAGTVEFLVTDGEFYFLEVNTRIQVEHTVTEEITGIDVVAWQIRIAAGEELDFEQEDVSVSGHAIEYRINAEDASQSFEPATGTITRYDPPGRIGVRLDDAIREGDDIGGDYDSMIGKLIVSAPTRDACLARSRRALEEFELGGVQTTIPFHQFVLETDAFASGEYTTNYLDHELDTDALADAIEQYDAETQDGDGESVREVTVVVSGKTFTVQLSGDDVDGDLPPGEHPLDSTAETQSASTSSTSQSGTGEVDPDDDSVVTTGMDGTILSIAVAEGDVIESGDELCVLESMKMENAITASTGGTVEEVLVENGQSVVSGDQLVRLEPAS